MRQIIKAVTIVAMLFTFGTQTSNAQLGNILKKVKKVADAVSGKDNTTTQTATADGVKETTLANGVTMQNPLSGVVDFELVGVYAKSTSLNYGYAYVVLKVKMIANKSSIVLGGGINGSSALAVDQDGNAYKMSTNGLTKSVTEGIAVKIALNEKEACLLDVKKTAKTFQVLRLGVYVNASNLGMLTFKNVPIQWDVEP